MKKITYLLGAGASALSCPILNNLGKKMVEMARSLDTLKWDFDLDKSKSKLTEEEAILWDIGHFGKKALRYGTIDTYAKKLDLNKSHRELERLKVAVSIFFTLWQLCNETKLKLTEDKKSFEEIDRRYIALMASILQRNQNKEIAIKDNIKFVSWNYDLQLEYAFKAFCPDSYSWKEIEDLLVFRLNDQRKQNVCHLNGYHGYYNTKEGEVNFLDRTELKGVREILDVIKYIPTSQKQNSIDVTNHINYAWEDNPNATKTRDRAIEIFSETDILIVIGYSFPTFNKDIDQQLFKSLGTHTEIYYQDPNASENYINELVVSLHTDIKSLTKHDNFFLPYNF